MSNKISPTNKMGAATSVDKTVAIPSVTTSAAPLRIELDPKGSQALDLTLRLRCDDHNAHPHIVIALPDVAILGSLTVDRDGGSGGNGATNKSTVFLGHNVGMHQFFGNVGGSNNIVRTFVDGVEITSPGGRMANANTGSFTVQCGDVGGSVKTSNGDLTCRNVKGDVTTKNGNVYCGDVSGDVRTVNGSIHAETLQGKATTVNGGIHYGKRKREVALVVGDESDSESDNDSDSDVPVAKRRKRK